MKHLATLLFGLALFSSLASTYSCQAAGQPDLNELPQSQATPVATAQGVAVRFNDLNTRIRDGRVARSVAQAELKGLIDELRSEYYRQGRVDHPRSAWVFPLAGYDSRAITGGRNKGYIASGYDYFSGNRHGGHPSFDIFIRDRDQDSLDDRSGKPVKVLSLTGGIVVALEREWEAGSRLRGGKYIWIFDPTSDLLVYYAHNSELLVELGAIVKPGDVLASVGRSGLNAAKRRSPTHLHLTVLKVENGRPHPLNMYNELKQMRTIADR